MIDPYLFQTMAGDITLLKLLLAIMLFAILLKGTTKIFPENTASATIVSLLISMLSLVFIPEQTIYALLGSMGALGIFLLLGLVLIIPWMLIDSTIKPKGLKMCIIVYSTAYIILLYLFKGVSESNFIYNLNPDISYILSSIVDKVIILGVIALMVGGVFFIFRWVLG